MKNKWRKKDVIEKYFFKNPCSHVFALRFFFLSFNKFEKLEQINRYALRCGSTVNNFSHSRVTSMAILSRVFFFRPYQNGEFEFFFFQEVTVKMKEIPKAHRFIFDILKSTETKAIELSFIFTYLILIQRATVGYNLSFNAHVHGRKGNIFFMLLEFFSP